jgi:nucleoside 2-deoxyribosyltransferase/sugar/nucleoside kinase (ribokinase family)
MPSHGHPYKLRAGGIMHAARALWALGCPYSLCYCAPDYLVKQIAENGKQYGASHVAQWGSVTGCPNVMIVGEPKEAGDQGYEYLLRDAFECHEQPDVIAKTLADSKATDALIFTGGFNLQAVLRRLSATQINVFADANFEPRNINELGNLGRPFETIIYSTSSKHFSDMFSQSIEQMRTQLLGKYARSFLLKENRGGSRFVRDETISTPAQQRLVQHSIGVGDCFDAVYVALRHQFSDRASLAYASCIAAEYACTTYPEDFRAASQAWLQVPPDEIDQLQGISLPWEARRAINVYVAAPDFDYVDRLPIDTVAACLTYHNFTPRLPVRENGQMGENASPERRQALCDADLAVLAECQLLVAVMIHNDPGTLIEIGIASERGIPVIVYDPFSRADNLMLTQIPLCVSSDLDEIVSAVFAQASKVARHA